MKIANRCGVVVALALSAAGCHSGYEVDVRNLTDQPIVATLNAAHTDGTGRLLASARLGPGDRAGLFTQTDSKERVRLAADFAGNLGYPATLDVIPGRTVANIRRADTGSKGKLLIEEVPRP